MGAVGAKSVQLITPDFLYAFVIFVKFAKQKTKHTDTGCREGCGAFVPHLDASAPAGDVGGDG